MNHSNHFAYALPVLLISILACTAHAQLGACCLGDGNCIETTAGGCMIVEGDFIGDGTVCDGISCEGACCQDNNACDVVSKNDCLASRGEFKGPESTCIEDCPTNVDTAFSYQGQLLDTGRPVNDSADLRFSLFETATGNDQIGLSIELDDVDVVKGLFTVELDFGDTAFNGETRWLRVDVRSPHDPTDTASFTTLSPRQLITPTPYALQTRGIIVNRLGWVGINGPPPNSGLSANLLVRGQSHFINPASDFGVMLWGDNQDGRIGFRRPGNSVTTIQFLNTNGLGIKRSPSTNDLEVEGTASKSTAGSWLSNSDLRIKKNVTPVSHAVDTLSRINPVSFEYTEDYLKTHAGIVDRTYLNVLAQEFAEIFPGYVQGSGEHLEDGTEILQVDTYPLIIYSAAAIRELNEQLIESSKRVNSLVEQLEQSRSEMEGLRQRIQNIEANSDK